MKMKSSPREGMARFSHVKGMTGIQRRAYHGHERAHDKLGGNAKFLEGISEIVGNRGYSHVKRIHKVMEAVDSKYESLNEDERSYVQGVLNVSRRYISNNKGKIKDSESALYFIRQSKDLLHTKHSYESGVEENDFRVKEFGQILDSDEGTLEKRLEDGRVMVGGFYNKLSSSRKGRVKHVLDKQRGVIEGKIEKGSDLEKEKYLVMNLQNELGVGQVGDVDKMSAYVNRNNKPVEDVILEEYADDDVREDLEKKVGMSFWKKVGLVAAGTAIIVGGYLLHKNSSKDEGVDAITRADRPAVVNTDLSFLEKTGGNFYGDYEFNLTTPVAEERHAPLIVKAVDVKDVNDYAVKGFVGPMPEEKFEMGRLADFANEWMEGCDDYGVENVSNDEIEKVGVKKRTGPLELIGGVLEFGNHVVKGAVYGVGGLAKGGIDLALDVGEFGVGAGLNITEGGIYVVGEGAKAVTNVASRPFGGVAGGLEGTLTGNGNSFENGWKEAGEITDGIFDGTGKITEGTFAVAKGVNEGAFYLMRQGNDGLFHVAGHVGDEFFDNFYGGKRYNQFHDKLLRLKPGEALGVLNDDGNWLLAPVRGAQIYVEDMLIWNLFSKGHGGGSGSGSGSDGGFTKSGGSIGGGSKGGGSIAP